jgi:hypothetical protein
MNRHRKLAIECLENRRVMAGNVIGRLVGNELRLTGDRLGNSIEISSGVSPAGVRQLVVRGREFEGGFTTINNALSQSFNEVNSLLINSGDGNDKIVIGPENTFLRPPTPEDVRIRLNRLKIDSGKGNDSIALRNTDVVNAATQTILNSDTAGFAGNDEITFKVFQLFNTNAAGEFVPTASPGVILNTAGGADEVLFAGAVVEDATGNEPREAYTNIINSNVYANLGAGNDTFKSTFFNFAHRFEGAGDRASSLFINSAAPAGDTGFDDDTISLARTSLKNLSVTTGTGNDSFKVGLGDLDSETASGNVFVIDSTNLDMGAGSDLYFTELFNTGNLNVDMGQTNEIDIVRSRLTFVRGSATFSLGGGNDNVRFANSVYVFGVFTLNGGAGIDRFQYEYVHLNEPAITEIESIIEIPIY